MVTWGEGVESCASESWEMCCGALWYWEGGKHGEQTLGTGYSVVRYESFGKA